MKSLIARDLSFRRAYLVLASRWHWMVAIAVLGGLIGLLVSFALPAEYRATASLGVGIDYGRSAPLGGGAERIAYLQVQELLLSDETLTAVIEQLEPEVLARNDIEAPADLRSRMRIDRFEGRWDLSARAQLPRGAAQMVNAWLEVSVRSLREAVGHAIRAGELQAAIYELGCELTPEEDGGVPLWRCRTGDPESVDQIAQQLVEEIERSRGVLPALTFAALREAPVPEKPLYRGRSWMLLGGVLAGFAVGLGLVIYRAPASNSPAEPND